MLTAAQHRTYQFICKYINEYGYAPTTAEIALGIGIKSRGVVHRYLASLQSAGHIRLLPNRRRNIELLDNEPERRGIPIIGRIAAGHPIEAIEEPTYIDITDRLLGPNRFILEIVGDSMVGDNICDGDYIVCEKTNVVGKHEIAVVLVDGLEATLKRLKHNDDETISLLPSNPTHQPQVLHASRVQIQGVYLGLLRIGAIC